MSTKIQWSCTKRLMKKHCALCENQRILRNKCRRINTHGTDRNLLGESGVTLFLDHTKIKGIKEAKFSE